IGVVVQFGGQTAINLADKLSEKGIKILGTSLEDLNRAEDRKEFEALLQKINVPQPLGKTATSVEEAIKNANEIGYPVVVRRSEEHTSELQSRFDLVCRLLLEKKNT